MIKSFICIHKNCNYWCSIRVKQIFPTRYYIKLSSGIFYLVIAGKRTKEIDIRAFTENPVGVFCCFSCYEYVGKMQSRINCHVFEIQLCIFLINFNCGFWRKWNKIKNCLRFLLVLMSMYVSRKSFIHYCKNF